MTIWVDADSAPAKVRELCARAARRVGGKACYVSAKPLPLPEGPGVSSIAAGPGEGAADDAIMADARPGDLVVTRDILLAERAVAAGVMALNDRGDFFEASTIRERVSARNAGLAIRLSGLEGPGIRSYGPREAQAFANALDRALRKLLGNAPIRNQGSGSGPG